ncbi:MAG: GDSL-type esterase/lipase family protein [Butyricicoccus sp.]|nr:GDSL-type esterase/lipase family protein [Butyricicoccus sp.]
MKSILFFGDSNTWGYDPRTGGRYSPEVRYTGRLRSLLSDHHYEIIESGLNGRTTAYDDGFDGYSSGSKALPILLKTHDPIDLVVIMLGTNDLKDRLGLTVDDVVKGMRRLIHMVHSPGMWHLRHAPAVLAVAPMLLNEHTLLTSPFGEVFSARSVARSRQLGSAYEALCADESIRCCCFDAGQLGPVTSSDGVHMSPDDHRRLADALASILPSILGA